MHNCPDDVPAQRVINRLGEVTGDPVDDGAAVRRSLLEAEGVRFDQRGRCDLSRYGWEPDPE